MQFQRLQDFSKLLSCSDVAEKYEVSRATVLLHCKSGKIKGCARTRHGGCLIDSEEPARFWPVRCK